MNEVFLIAADYLKGKSVYSPIRRGMNLLLNISIASFIYEKLYGHYTWLNYNDYKGILDFFVKGNFFIPFSIFIAVYGLTQFISICVFYGLNHFKTLKMQRSIIAYQLKQVEVDKHLKEINKVSKHVAPYRLTKPMMLQIAQELNKHITPEVLEQMQKELKEPQQNLEASFHFIFRLLIAITIYFYSIPHFGWLLYAVALLTLWGAMYVLMFAYRFLDILPLAFRKFNAVAQEYILAHQKETEQK